MRLERFKNAKRNSIWGIISKIVGLLLPFLTRTILIKELGVEYLGLNGLLTSILNVLNLTELGIGSAIVFSMYKPLAENDERKICALMSLYKRIYRYIGCFVLILGMIILPFLQNLISGDIPKNVNIYILYLIYLLNSVISYWLFAYRNCLLQVHQRNDITSKISILLNIFMYLLQIVFLITFKNYYVYVLIMPIFSVLTNIVTAVFSLKMYPQYKCYGEIEKSEIKELRKRVFGLMLTKIAYSSRNSFDSIVISIFMGLELVAVYSNYYYVSNSLSAILVIFTTAMSAGIGNSLVIEKKEKNIKDLNIISFIYITISGFCFSCLIALYQPFMNLWVGEKLIVSDKIMFLFAIYFIVEKSLNVIGQYYDAAGLWWKGKWKGFIESIANLILNIIFCYYFGLAGIIFATIITIIFIGFPLTSYYVFKYAFEENSKKYIFKELLYIFLFIIIGVFVYFICNFIPLGDTLILKIIYMGVRLLVTCIITLLLYILLFIKTLIFRDSFSWIRQHLKNA